MARDNPAPPRPAAQPASAVAIIIAAAVAISAPFTAPREGLRTHPYRDPPGIATVCYGDTRVAMRVYTPAECLVMLQARQARDYAPQVLACVPGLADPRRRDPFAASIDFAYNAGPAAFCRSYIAIHFNAGRWAKGCNAFVGRYVTARINGRPTVLRGLVDRRVAERALCLRGAL